MCNDIPLDEIIEEIELMSNIFIKIEKQNGVMTNEQYLRIFRILHNLKGTLAMCGKSEASHFVHILEDYFMTFQNAPLAKSVLDYFIQSSQLLLDNVVIQAPLHIEFCIDQSIDLKTIEKVTLVNNEVLLNQTKQDNEILIISNSPHCIIEQILKDKHIQYYKISNHNEIFTDLEFLKQVKTILINLSEIDMHISGFIRVLNKYLGHIDIIIIGDRELTKGVDIFFADIQFRWIGLKSNKLNQLISKLE